MQKRHPITGFFAGNEVPSNISQGCSSRIIIHLTISDPSLSIEKNMIITSGSIKIQHSPSGLP